MRTNRRHMLVRRLGIGTAVTFTTPRKLMAAHTLGSTHQQTGPANAPMFVPLDDVKWSRIPPIPGKPAPCPNDPWPEIAILREAPGTRATQLFIRVPKNFHVPKHWGTANETHTIVSGTFIMECEGQRAELGPGRSTTCPAR